MKFTIKNRYSPAVIFECEAANWCSAIQKAIENGANLSKADLSKANLSWDNLSGADLNGANLSGADLSWANLSGTSLSQSKGIMPASSYLSQFDRDALGILVYRAQVGIYSTPEGWSFQPGNFLTETPNPCRTCDCGCGVSFATLAWVREHYATQSIWKCRVRFEDLADVVVPFATDGKARCARLELIELI